MNRIKVIIVEDDMITAKDLAQSLESEGYEIVGIACNARHALEIVRSKKPDIALIDIGLGRDEMDGIELAAHILEYYDMPIIFITAYADQQTIDRTKQFLDAEYLVKPVNIKQLTVSIERAMDRFINKHKSDETTTETVGKKTKRDYSFKNEGIYIKKNNDRYKNELSDILYIEATGNYSTIYTTVSHFTIISSLCNFLKDLAKPAPFIVRVHRSYAVNINHIVSCNNHSIHLKNTSKVIPIGKGYRDDFFKQIGLI